jgi:hypothetical protein
MKRSKYGACPTVVDGIRFHSAGEARHYQELKLLERCKQIEHIRLQPRFALHAGGKLIGHYVADFQYWDVARRDWITVDYKGVWTSLSKWKIKHYVAEYGHTIEIKGAAA